MNRRGFLHNFWSYLLSLAGARWLLGAKRAVASVAHEENGKLFGMGIQVDKCIGCGLCMQACKSENDVPPEPFFFRTWVEQYVVKRNGEVAVNSIGTYRI